MSSEMSILRKEDLSLYLYIKDIILKKFIEVDEYVPLEIIGDLCDKSTYVYEALSTIEPGPTERGRGWVYFDAMEPLDNCLAITSVLGTNAVGDPAIGTPEQTSRVTVYENVNTTPSGIVVPQNDYMIDYVDGRIVSNRPLVDPAVTYYWNYVSVVDEWAVIEASDPPVVVIDIHGTDKKGYQLGGGKRSIRKVDLHVFASHPAERNDLVETLYDGLFNKSTIVLDFPTGSVLDYNGTFTGRGEALDGNNKLTFLFDRRAVENISPMYFDAVTTRHVNLPLIMTRGKDEVILSDLNAYRSKVSFDVFTYDDRII